MPRQPKDIHIHFDTIRIPAPGKKKATYIKKCLFCAQEMCSNICTILKHYRECNGTQQTPNLHEFTYSDDGMRITQQVEVKNNDDDGNNDDDEVMLADISIHDNESAKKIATKIKILKQRKIDGYTVPQLTRHQQELADLYLSLWCITSKIPFAAFDSVWLKAHYKVIRDSYKCPNRKKMSNELIPERKKEIQSIVKDHAS